MMPTSRQPYSSKVATQPRYRPLFRVLRDAPVLALSLLRFFHIRIARRRHQCCGQKPDFHRALTFNAGSFPPTICLQKKPATQFLRTIEFRLRQGRVRKPLARPRSLRPIRCICSTARTSGIGCVRPLLAGNWCTPCARTTAAFAHWRRNSLQRLKTAGCWSAICAERAAASQKSSARARLFRNRFDLRRRRLSP